MHSEPFGDRVADQLVPWIGYERRAGVAHKRNALTGAQAGEKPGPGSWIRL